MTRWLSRFAWLLLLLAALSPLPGHAVPGFLPAVTEAAAATPAPQAAATGVDLAGRDLSVKPGDDFEAYANGGWSRTAQIPPDRASTGMWLVLVERAERRTLDLVRGLDNAPPALRPAWWPTIMPRSWTRPRFRSAA